MCKNRGSIVEAGRAIVKTIFGTFSFVAFADEDPTKTPPTGDTGGGGEDPSKTSGVVNYEDLIAKARKEEKDKQYKTIEGLKTQVGTLTTQHNNDLLRIAELEQQVEAANKKLAAAGSGDSEAVQTLKTEVANLQKDKTTLEAKVKELEGQKPASREEIEAEVRKQLEAEYEVRAYKAEQLAAHKDEILVPEMVGGDTKEAIDQSVTAAINRSNEIKKQLGIKDKKPKDKNPEPQQNQQRQPRTPNPSTSPLQGQTIDMETLATMDVRSPEYAALRKQLGLA